MYSNIQAQITALKTAIAECETNIANFMSGCVKPDPGEIAFNRYELTVRKARLHNLEQQVHEEEVA